MQVKDNKKLIQTLRLCLITHKMSCVNMEKYLHFIQQAIAGGVTMVQYREKEIFSLPILKKNALLLKNILPPSVPLIINDYVELAAEIDADGVHLGQNDMNAIQARNILGTKKTIGISIENLQELDIANQQQTIDYVTASAVFSSSSKKNCKKIWGLHGLKQIVKKSLHPVTAIGGITKSNIKKVLKSGACGIAVISALHNNYHPQKTASQLLNNFYT